MSAIEGSSDDEHTRASRIRNMLVAALTPVLANLPAKIIAIGGHPGSGKTSLGRFLAWKFNVSLIETDLFLDDDRGKLIYRSNEIARLIDKRMKKPAPVIAEGVVVLRLLGAVGRPADFTIYAANENAPETTLADEIATYEAEHTPCPASRSCA